MKQVSQIQVNVEVDECDQLSQIKLIIGFTVLLGVTLSDESDQLS